MNKPIKVKITRAERRGRKIILVLESDLYSHETFAVNPFYNEGDAKNQLDAIHFDIKVTENDGAIDAKVDFGNSLSHFTKGHRQLHQCLETYYLDRRSMAMNWVQSTQEKWFTDDKIEGLLAHWENEDSEFAAELKDEIRQRKAGLHQKQLDLAEASLLKALADLKQLLPMNKETNQ